MTKSKIEWTDRVWNPVTGCSHISPGCDNCYAERMSNRFADTWGLSPDDPFKVTLHSDRLKQPLGWKKASRIFVCSMSDLFHDDVPDDFIIDVFSTMAHGQWFNGHKFLVLTKRPERMKRIIETIKADIEEQRIPTRNADGTTTRKMTFSFPLQNIWLGVTAENQEQADKRIPILLQIPAVIRFVSVEPMLSAVKILDYLGEEVKWDCHGKEISRRPGLNWVICGGESGPGARPMHPDWARGLRDQCQTAGVPYFFKQYGEWEHVGECGSSDDDSKFYQDRNVRRVNHNGGMGYHGAGAIYMQRVGKKKAGCLLDGREWKEMPGVRL